jgi:hypothetical protein
LENILGFIEPLSAALGGIVAESVGGTKKAENWGMLRERKK